MRLDSTKSTLFRNITAGMLKSKIDIHASILTKIINLYLRNSCFLDDLKDAEVSPIFKKWWIREGKLSMFYLTSQRSLERSCILKLKVSWSISYWNYLQDSEKSYHLTVFNQYAWRMAKK